MEEYCAYLRKSRADLEAELHGQGETLLRHEHMLQEASKRLNIPIKKFYREVVSGETIQSRPVMQQLLREVESGMWAGVFVVEVERLARGDTIDQGTVSRAFKFTATKIITPLKIYNPENEFDEEFFEFGLFMSRREYKTTNRRLQAGRVASVKEGLWPFNTSPYGYDREKVKGGKGFILIPNDESDTVRLIFHLFLDNGMSMTAIADKLNSLSIPPRKSKRWSVETIRGILKNPVYTGNVFIGRRPLVKSIAYGNVEKSRPRSESYIECKGQHEPLITKEMYNNVIQLLSARSTASVRKDRKMTNPFAGIVVCKKCGHRMVRKNYTSKTGYKYDMILCTNRYCDNVSSSFCEFERIILQTLAEWTDRYRISFSPDDEPAVDLTYYDSTISTLNEDMTKLKNQLDKCYTLLEQEIYTVEVFAERSAKIKEELASKQSSIDIITKERNEVLSKQGFIRDMIPRITYLLQNYESIDSIEEKNRLLKQIVSKILYEKNERNKKGQFNNVTFSVDVFPLLPKN